MKLAVVSALVLLVVVGSAHARWGEQRGRGGGGDDCMQDSDCDTSTEKCATTYQGNKCKRPKECAADADCMGGDECFKDSSNSASPSLGYCNGCSSTDDSGCDTANGESCIIYGSGSYGYCGVSCTSAADCSAAQFCTGGVECGGRRGGRGRGDRGGGRGRRGRDKPSVCKDKKATGERCCHDSVCTSGTCSDNRCT